MDDLAKIIPTLVAWFTPYLPTLLNMASKTISTIGVKAGETVIEKGTEAFLERQPLWQKLIGHPNSQKLIQAANNVANDPIDEDYSNKFKKELTNLLQQNPDLLAEVTPLLPTIEMTATATRNSKVENIEQTHEGKGGPIRMNVSASDNSTISGVKQSVKSK
jgi:hypothetical protein